MLKLTSRRASLAALHGNVSRGRHSKTIEKPSVALQIKAGKTQAAIYDAVNASVFTIAEQKTALFSVDVSLTLCKQAPVSTRKEQFVFTPLTTKGQTKKLP